MCLLPGSCREAVFGVPTMACWYPPLDNQALGVLFTCVTHAHTCPKPDNPFAPFSENYHIRAAVCLGRLQESPSGQKEAISAPTALVTL